MLQVVLLVNYRACSLSQGAGQTWDTFKANGLPSHFKRHFPVFMPFVLCTDEVLKPVPKPYFYWISKQVSWGSGAVLAKDFFFSPSPKLLKSSTIHDIDFIGTALVLSP